MQLKQETSTQCFSSIVWQAYGNSSRALEYRKLHKRTAIWLL